MMVESLRHRDGEAAAGARTPEPKRGDDTRYHYYVSRGRSSSFAVFVCDHAYDCEPLCREACEQEVIALIGTDALRAAQRRVRLERSGLQAPARVRWSHQKKNRSAELPSAGEIALLRLRRVLVRCRAPGRFDELLHPRGSRRRTLAVEQVVDGRDGIRLRVRLEGNTPTQPFRDWRSPFGARAHPRGAGTVPGGRGRSGRRRTCLPCCKPSVPGSRECGPV